MARRPARAAPETPRRPARDALPTGLIAALFACSLAAGQACDVSVYATLPWAVSPAVGFGTTGAVGVAAADFNDDERLDAAVGVRDHDAVSVIYAECDGGFTPLRPFGIGTMPEAIVAADLNGDGALNVLDFVAFQLAGIADDPAADCDGDGAFTAFDSTCFRQRLHAGCP